MGPRRWNQRGPTQPPVCRDKGDMRGALCTGPRPVDKAQQGPSPGESRVPGRGGSHPEGASREAHAGQPVPRWRGKACTPQMARLVLPGQGPAQVSPASGEDGRERSLRPLWPLLGSRSGKCSREPQLEQVPPTPASHGHTPEPAPLAQGAPGGRLCLHDLSSMTTWHRCGIPAQCPRPAWDPGTLGLADTHTASQAGQGPCPEPQ